MTPPPDMGYDAVSTVAVLRPEVNAWPIWSSTTSIPG